MRAFPRHEAHVYAEGIRRGGTLVSVRADESRAETATAIFAERGRRRHRPLAARTTLREGWQGFDEEAPAYSPEQIRDYRSTYVAPLPPM